MRWKSGTILLASAFSACSLSLPAVPARAANNMGPVRDRVKAVVEVEEVVTRYTPANNGAGPLWCYGSTVIARQGSDVYLSVIETGKDVPPLCNTRWQLWRRTAQGWKMVQTEKKYRQREPCPIAIFHKGPVFLSVNPSVEPRGVQYGRCRPQVLEFDSKNPAGSFKVHLPAWANGTHLTDHSYRGFAADGANGELLALNINARTSEQFVSYCDSEGRWHQKGKIKFPIRACYPQVALRDGAAHIMAIGDIVEPVEQWRKLKFEKLKRKWDYVFRRLFYTFTPDISKAAFADPIEVDTVEETAGHIRNLDLYIDDAGAAHLLYLKRAHQYGFIRDKYFPGQAMTVHLEYMVIKGGKIVSKKALVETGGDSNKLRSSFARFHVRPNGQLYAIVAGTATGPGGGFANYIGRIPAGPAKPALVRIGLKHPFGNFFTNTPRAGSQPSDIIDVFGIADDGPNLRYARIRLVSGGK